MAILFPDDLEASPVWQATIPYQVNLVHGHLKHTKAYPQSKLIYHVTILLFTKEPQRGSKTTSHPFETLLVAASCNNSFQTSVDPRQ